MNHWGEKGMNHEYRKWNNATSTPELHHYWLSLDEDLFKLLLPLLNCENIIIMTSLYRLTYNK